MAVKTLRVETCDFCDRYTGLTDCSICGRKVCSNHFRVFEYKRLTYPLDGRGVRICPECEQKPFREVWNILEKRAWNTLEKRKYDPTVVRV